RLAGAILNVAFQSAPGTDAGHRGRLEDNDKSIIEAGQRPPKVGADPRSWEAPAGPFLERRQGKENRAGIRRVGECRAVETDKRGRVQHGGVLENFSDSLANNFIGSIERRAGRKLKGRDQITSIKLWDEPGGRCAQLPIGERDYTAINNQDDEGNSNETSGQPAIALG